MTFGNNDDDDGALLLLSVVNAAWLDPVAERLAR
jgi:hypothetical protein